MLTIAYISFPDNWSCICRNSRSSLSRDLFTFATKAFHESLFLENGISSALLDAVRMIVDISQIKQKGMYIQIFYTINRINAFLPKRLGQCSRQDTPGKNSLKKQTIDVGGRNRHGQKKMLGQSD